MAQSSGSEFPGQSPVITNPFFLRFKIAASALIAEALYYLLQSSTSDKPDSGLVPGQPAQELIETDLKRVLQRHPCWARGHLLLGHAQLRRKEKRGAYACALAAVELLGADALGPALLKGKVYLQSGREGEAVQILEQLLHLYPDNVAVLEELGAGYLHQGRDSLAHQTLRKIPDRERSPEVCATLSYLLARSEES